MRHVNIRIFGLSIMSSLLMFGIPAQVVNDSENCSAIRGVFPLAISLSKKYNVDADKRAEWQEVLDNLAPYPRSEMAGAIAGLGPGTWAQGLAPHGTLRGNGGDESPRMGPVRGDFDVLTLESLDTTEWAVAMAT